MVELVRGKIIGGTGPDFLIGVNGFCGRTYDVKTGFLTRLWPLVSIIAHAPWLNEPFPGDAAAADRILEAARNPRKIQEQVVLEGFELPNVDIIPRDVTDQRPSLSLVRPTLEQMLALARRLTGREPTDAEIQRAREILERFKR